VPDHSKHGRTLGKDRRTARTVAVLSPSRHAAYALRMSVGC
jgi:hypothetical protein